MSYSNLLERSVLTVLLLGHAMYERPFFRFNEIMKLTGVEKSTLQRVLKRLVKWGWIEKKHIYLAAYDEPFSEALNKVKQQRYIGTQNTLGENVYNNYSLRKLTAYERARREKHNKEEFRKLKDSINSLDAEIYRPDFKPLYDLTYVSKAWRWFIKPEDFDAYRLRVFPYVLSFNGCDNIPKRDKRAWKKLARQLECIGLTKKLLTLLLPLLTGDNTMIEKTKWYESVPNCVLVGKNDHKPRECKSMLEG